VYGPDGTALYSWRVLLLPYIEQQALYDEFRRDEPWDSSHNIRLLDRMPATYAPPGHKKALVPPNHTVCHVFVGPGTAFEGPRRLKLSDDFPDGTSDTLLLVEAGEPVPWTKPADLAYDPAGPLPPLPGLFKGGFRACTADGARRWVQSDTPEAVLRAVITRNGGEKLGPVW
jgi:hypothetical protein